MRIIIRGMFFLILILFFGGSVKAELTGKEIAEKANQVAYYQGEDGKAKVNMQIIDSQGRKRFRQFIILRKDGDNGEQKFYVYFLRPADVNRMVFMVWKHLNKDDDRWLYLPALDLVKRIAASDKRTSFVGSHFFYEDVSGRNINADKHELVKTIKNFYVLKNIPKDSETVEFSYYITWIYKKNFITVKVEYFDKNNEKYREYTALKVQNIQGYPTVVKSQMLDKKIGGKTLLYYTHVKYNIGLPEVIFTERYLRKAPRKFLRQ